MENIEKRTIRIMIEIFCRGIHQTREELCEDCSKLLEYSLARIDGCVYGTKKPVCSDCLIHCYGKEMRDKIRTVMRYAGPRMIFYHPVLAIKHLLRKKPKYKLAELLGGITENKLHEEQSSVPPVGKEEW